MSSLLDQISSRISEALVGEFPNEVHADGFIEHFMASWRGQALVFEVMNEIYRPPLDGIGAINSEPFRSIVGEWRGKAPIEWCKTGRIIDCHVHFVEPGLGQVGVQYREGANKNWWFAPHFYKFSVNDDRVHAKLDYSPSDHDPSNFIGTILRTISRYREFKCCIQPAPGVMQFDPTSLDPQGYARRVAAAVNSITGAEVCFAAGVISADQDNPPQFSPGSATQNSSGAWKIYPSGVHWGDENGRAWMREKLAPCLARLSEIKPNATICIHWWDGDQPPHENDLGYIADKFKGMRFVIFHSAFPHVRELANIMRQRSNVYAEIGGMFANQILGGDGEDGNPGAFENQGGPQAAIQTINILRGIEGNQKSGPNDDKIVWGTDAIWHGSPVWQIEAFKRLVLTTSESKDKTFKLKVLDSTPAKVFQFA